MVALLASTAACLLALYGLLQTEAGRDRLRRTGIGASADVVGIWRDDPRLGYRHQAVSSGFHRTAEFAVRYTIDAHGCRTVPPRTDADDHVLFLGDSFTFGHGVGDHEAFPAVLAASHWPHAQVQNCGVMGWGTGQAYLALEERLLEQPLPTAVVYGWTSADLQRNYLRRSWLATLDASGRRTVHFELDGADVALRGPAELVHAVPDDAPHLADRERAVTRSLLRDMARRCAARSVPFVVVILPTRAGEDEIGDWLVAHGASSGIEAVDLRDVRGPYFKRDGHPKPTWHVAVALALAERASAPLGVVRRPRT